MEDERCSCLPIRRLCSGISNKDRTMCVTFFSVVLEWLTCDSWATYTLTHDVLIEAQL